MPLKQAEWNEYQDLEEILYTIIGNKMVLGVQDVDGVLGKRLRERLQYLSIELNKPGQVVG